MWICITVLSLLLILVFTVLACIHFNWVIGGTYGFSKSIPTKENGERLFNPKIMDSAVVGLVLLGFGGFYLIKSGLIQLEIWQTPFAYASWIIAGIFVLRSIGEFKYLGFFKKIKDSEHEIAYRKILLPMCLGIGVVGVVINLVW